MDQSDLITDYRVRSLTTELAALEHLKIYFHHFYSDLFNTCITRTGIISYVFELVPGHCFKFRVTCL